MTKILIHPAYSEAAGMVLLEEIVAGLPVLVTDVCGFAHYINDAEAGIVEPSPFIFKDFVFLIGAVVTISVTNEQSHLYSNPAYSLEKI